MAKAEVEHITWDHRLGANFSSDGQWLTYERNGLMELWRRNPDRGPQYVKSFTDGGEIMDYIWSLTEESSS